MNFIKVLFGGVLGGTGMIILTVFGLLPQSWLSIDIAELTLEIIPQNFATLVISYLSIIFCIVFFIISSNRKARARHFLKNSLAFIAGVYLVLLCWLVFDFQKFPIQGVSLFVASILVLFIASTILLLEGVDWILLLPKVKEEIAKFNLWINSLENKKNTDENTLENDDEPISFAEFVKIYNSGGNQHFDHFKDFIDSLIRLNKKLTIKSLSKSSQVICLDGKWGSGKSSFIKVLKDFNPELLKSNIYKNLELTPIKKEIDDGKIIWVEDFNPWNFGNSSEMIREFFAVLEQQLDSKAGLYLDINYNEYVEMVSQSLEQTTFFKSLFQILFAKKTTPQIKKQIEDKLKEVNKKIVFVLDDMDRQAPNDVLEVLRLVKSVANFPNMIFILPMDYKRVSSIIVKEYGESYQNYLQKIFQERVKINDFNFEDLFAIFRFYTGDMLKLEHGEDLQRLLYEYYRIQVWRIGIRARIDGLIKSGDINGFSKKSNEVFDYSVDRQKQMVLRVFNYLMGTYRMQISKETSPLSKRTLQNNFTADIKKFIRTLYHNKGFDIVDRQLSTVKGLRDELEKIQKPLFEESHYRKIQNGPKIYPVVESSIDEFKPTVRDLKEFARMISVKTDISIEKLSLFLTSENQVILSVNDMQFVDNIISEQYFDFV